MRISDWSSDVCSSDLHAGSHRLPDAFSVGDRQHAGHGCVDQAHLCIRLSTKGRGGSGEELRLRRDLRMDLQADDNLPLAGRSEEHTSELQSLMRISYAVFCLKKKKN